MTAKDYQKQLVPKLQHIFPELPVTNEWAAFTGLIHQYSPRVDIALGPFNTESGTSSVHLYNELLGDDLVYDFLKMIFEYHVKNLDETLYNEVIHPQFDFLIRKNENSRCFLAIEIENRNSKKHIMGSIVNAASLGRVGIGIAFNEGTLRSFCRIVNYLSFLKRVEKNTYDVTNFLIITVDQLEDIYKRITIRY
jgi:hypothetical protein